MQNCAGSSKLCEKVRKTTGCADMCGKQFKVRICAEDDLRGGGGGGWGGVQP